MLQCFGISQFDEAATITVVVWLGILAVVLWVRKQSHFFGKHYFLVSLVAMLFWLAICFLELTSVETACKIMWAKAAWPMIVLLPTAWSFFLFDYAFGRRSAPRGWRAATLWIGPIAAAAIAFTNRYHFMFYGVNTRQLIQDGRASVEYDHGPLFYLAAAYLYVFLATSIIVTARGVFLAHPRYRMFFMGLLLITMIPAVANVLYVVFGFTVYGFDPTPFAFSSVLILLSGLIVNNQLMDIDSIAKDLLFYSTSDPIIVFDVEGGLVGANPEARRVFQADLPALGEDLRRTNDLGQVVVDVLQSGGRPIVRSLTARSRHFDLHVAPIGKPLDRAESRMGWVIRLNDVTERRFLAGALQAERDFLSKLMDTSMSGILALDDQGAFIFANAEAERILGIDPAGLKNLRYDDPEWGFELPDGGVVENLEQEVARFLTDTSPARDRRLSILRRSDGVRRVISLNATPLAHSEMTAKLVLAIVDITEQYWVERKLRDAAARAEAANRSKSQFIANMSHEIRTPLNGVLGMAEVLDRLVREPDQKRMVTTIRRSGELLLNILNDVLDMSKIEAGKLDLEAVPFRPDQIAARIEELHLQGAEEKGLAFEVYTSGSADVPRIGDPHRVMQILQNLVSNAIKFTHDGEVAVVISCPPGKPMQIEVRDTGIGMTPEQAGRIFEEFEQADGSVTRRFGGTGLGMAIVLRLAQMMDGDIQTKTAPGRGTTMTVTLPLAEKV